MSSAKTDPKSIATNSQADKPSVISRLKSKPALSSRQKRWLIVAILLFIILLPTIYFRIIYRYTTSPLFATQEIYRLISTLSQARLTFSPDQSYPSTKTSTPTPKPITVTTAQKLLYVQEGAAWQSSKLLLLDPQAATSKFIESSNNDGCYGYRYSLSPNGQYIARFMQNDYAIAKTIDQQHFTQIIGSSTAKNQGSLFDLIIPKVYAACSMFITQGQVWAPDSSIAIAYNTDIYKVYQSPYQTSTDFYIINTQNLSPTKIYTSLFSSSTETNALAVDTQQHLVWFIQKDLIKSTNKVNNTLLAIDYLNTTIVKKIPLESTDVITQGIDPWPGLTTEWQFLAYNPITSMLYYTANQAGRQLNIQTGQSWGLGQSYASNNGDSTGYWRWTKGSVDTSLADQVSINPQSTQAYITNTYQLVDGSSTIHGLLNLKDSTIKPILSTEQSFSHSAWSSDGRYLALFNMGQATTAIIDTNQPDLAPLIIKDANTKYANLIGWTTGL